MRKFISLVVFASLFFVGCGVKGPPLPPTDNDEDSISSLEPKDSPFTRRKKSSQQ